MITYPDGGDFIGHILAARDDVEVPQLGLETSVKVELHDDSVVDGERVETDAQERLQTPVEWRAADVHLMWEIADIIYSRGARHSRHLCHSKTTYVPGEKQNDLPSG